MPRKKTPKAAAAVSDDDSGTRRLWKRVQVLTQLPEKDQRAVIRLINSLAAIATPRLGSESGERHGR